jgi:hypothetical protein
LGAARSSFTRTTVHLAREQYLDSASHSRKIGGIVKRATNEKIVALFDKASSERSHRFLENGLLIGEALVFPRHGGPADQENIHCFAESLFRP